MALPTPQQFRDLIISEGDSVCIQLQKVATFSKLSSDLIAEIYKEDGDLTDSFLALVCALDCTGTGAPGATTTTTTATTGSAPGSVIDNNLYSFVTTRDVSGFLESEMFVINGDTYDASTIISVTRQVVIASNVTITSAALHPTTGVLYALGVDGTLQTSQAPASLYSVDKVTGVLSLVGAITIQSSGLPLYWFQTASTAVNQRRLRFDPSDNQAYMLEVTGSESFLYELDLGTQEISNPLDLGVVGVVDVTDQISLDIHFGPTGTPYTASSDSFGTFSLTTDPTYVTSLPTNYGGNFSPTSGLNSMILRVSEFSYIVANGPSLMVTDATTSNVETLAPTTASGQTLSSIFGGKMPMATAYLVT